MGISFLPFGQDLRDLLIKALAGRARPILPALRAMDAMFRNGGIIQPIRKIKNGLSTRQRFFMVIFDINIEDVHGVIERRALVHQVIDNSIPAAFLAGNDDIDDAALRAEGTFVALGEVVDARDAGYPVLEALGPPLQLAIAVEHVQDAVAAVQTLILAVELLVHLVVGSGVEAVHVWLGD